MDRKVLASDEAQKIRDMVEWGEITEEEALEMMDELEALYIDAGEQDYEWRAGK